MVVQYCIVSIVLISHDMSLILIVCLAPDLSPYAQTANFKNRFLVVKNLHNVVVSK